jgi:ribosomal protein L7/L12
VTPHSGDLPEQAKSLALEGKIMEAIKITRQQTGAGLIEAKNLINNYLQSRESGVERRTYPAAPSTRAIPAHAMLLLDEGKTIEAIKVTREKLGVDLRSAKEAVDLYLAQNPQIRRQ